MKWQATRAYVDKNKLHRATQTVPKLILECKINSINKYFFNLSNNKETEYSLWKAI